MSFLMFPCKPNSRIRVRLGGIPRSAVFWASCVFALVVAAVAAGPSEEPTTAQILRQMAIAENPLDNPFLSDRRAQRLLDLLESETDPVESLILRVQLAVELLHAGRTEDSLRVIRAVQVAARARQAPKDAPVMRSLRELAALASLRLGEQENCVVSDAAESCLMPIRGAGIHTAQRGSRGAVREYSMLLREEPENLAFRWLLNIAYMTLGQYPDQVPAQWLIPPSVFDSDHPLPRFREAAAAAGLASDGRAGGSVLEDFDGDGYLDLVVSSWMLRDQIRYFHNNGDGSFAEWTGRSGLSGQTGGLNVTQADYDNDGFPDLLILRGGWLGFVKKGLGDQPNSLLRNRGDGTFEDVTRHAGLLDFHPTQTAAWADYDRDGHLDLFVGNESSLDDRHPCRLFRNNGDGTFSDVAPQVGLAHQGFVKGVAWGDYDNDGLPDLYLSQFGDGNLLFHNDGPVDGGGWSFTDRTRQAGVRYPELSFPTWFWDYDNDGWEDLFAASFSSYSDDNLDIIAADYLDLEKAETPRLYRNNGDGTFSDATRESRMDAVLMAMGANFGDIDNDGFLDCYFGTGQPQMSTLIPNRMFRNANGKVFQDVTTAGGFGHLQKGHGISFGDIDADGDQDVYAVLGGAYSGDTFRNALFENPGNSNHWIALDLRGVSANRSGVGARIHIIVSGPAGRRGIRRTAGSGGSFGASSLRVHVGLGDAEKVESIEIRWPDRESTTQILREAPMDRVIRIVQGRDEFEVKPLKAFAIGRPKAEPAHRHPKENP